MWRLRLDATDEAIQRLCTQVPDPSCGFVFTREGEHWLFETLGSSGDADAKSALDSGNEVIGRLNFALSLIDQNHRAVAPSSTVVDEQAHVHHFIEARSVMSLSSFATAEVTTKSLPPTSRQRTRGELILALCELVPEIDEVAQIWADERGPVNLYKILEIVREHGRDGPCEIYSLQDRAAVSRFTHTVNHPAGAGHRARHARLSSQAPLDPMSETEAASFIAQLIDAWLRCLAAQHGVPIEIQFQNP